MLALQPLNRALPRPLTSAAQEVSGLTVNRGLPDVWMGSEVKMRLWSEIELEMH